MMKRNFFFEATIQKLRFSVLIAATLLSTVGVTLSDVGTSEAWGGGCGGGASSFNLAYNTWRWCGYFQNKLDTNGIEVLTGGIPGSIGDGAGNDANEFINFLGNFINGASGTQYKNGGQFIVQTMEGQNGGSGRITVGSATWNNWVSDMTGWQSAGRIDWHDPFFLGVGTLNTYYQDSIGGGDDSFYLEPAGTAHVNQTWDTIRICNIACSAPGAYAQYRIRRACGNPLGVITPPSKPDYSVTLSAAALTSENGVSPYKVVAGKNYSFQAVVHNNGPSTAGAGTLQVMLPASGVCSPSAPCPLNQANVMSGGSVTARGFRAGSAIGGTIGPGPNWYWNTSTITSGGQLTSTLQFMPNGAVGSTFNMEVYYTPGDLGGAIRHVTIPYVIISERTPGLSGANSDIHAGGGTCGGTLSNGNVTTSPSGASYGEYVVSASGSINSLFSNNANTAANDKLKVGNSGAYAQVCRPDLLTAAATGWPSGPGIHTIGGAGVTNYVLAGNEQGVYYFNGTHLNIHGAVGNPVAPGVAPAPVTVVALRPGAVVEIDGNIVLNNTTYSPHTVPSLGVISAGDILIDPAAIRVDAFLFSSQGTISTCNGTVAACATAQLVVNGFLMAKNLLFGRVGVTNTNGTPITESVVLAPQLYLNPPKYFDASVDDILLQGQGERAPLF
jgi:hypothetical protein